MSAVPHGHLVAESAAWPFWSDAAFAACTTRLSTESAGVLDRPTRRLADALEERLRVRARGLSLETLARIRDAAWFLRYDGAARLGPVTAGDRVDRSLADYLCALATDRLVLAGTSARLRSSQSVPLHVAAERWRWMSLAMPPDLIIAGAAAGNEPPADYIDLSTPLLESMLRDIKVAETHLHVGAAIPFELLWTHTMSRADVAVPDRVALERSGPCPFGNGHRFCDWLVTAALARVTLMSFLADFTGALRFTDFLDRLPGSRDEVAIHQGALRALCEGDCPLPVPEVQPVLRRYAGAPLRPPRGLDELCAADPLFARFDSDAPALPETRFLSRAVGYLKGAGADDAVFAAMFWQYVRIRVRTYRHLTQEPGVAGLDWFTRHFQRIGALRGTLDELAADSALRLESRCGGLRSLEVRTSPGASWQSVRDTVRWVARAGGLTEADGIERGLVLHFTKERGARGGAPALHADPRQIAYGCRYGAYFDGRDREARFISEALRRHPELLAVLRGLDVCSLELAVPTWVLLPLLQRVRDNSREVAGKGPPWMRPLRITLHVGEDFRHLLEGLRRVHEPVEFGLLGAGDRMGHAMALGVDVEAWSASAVVVTQPLEERLDDLLWELARYRMNEMEARASRVEHVRAQIEQIGRCLFGDAPSVDALLVARELRHDAATLEKLGFPCMVSGAAVTAMREGSDEGALLVRYLTDAEVFVRGQMPVEVPITASERDVLRAAQRFLRERLSQLGVTIEANPSSNLLIGDLAIEAHPIFRLQPRPGVAPIDGPTVPVALGDDDPVTFASCLGDEIAHLFYALQRRDVPTQDALEWLAQVLRNAWRARFTLEPSADLEVRAWVAPPATCV